MNVLFSVWDPVPVDLNMSIFEWDPVPGKLELNPRTNSLVARIQSIDFPGRKLVVFTRRKIASSRARFWGPVGKALRPLWGSKPL